MSTELAPKGKERRKSVRIDSNLMVHLEIEGIFSKALVTNISLGGVFVETEIIQPIETKVILHMFLPNQNEVAKVDSVKAKSTVAWSNPQDLHWAKKGIGLKFLEIEKQDKELIKEYISQISKT